MEISLCLRQLAERHTVMVMAPFRTCLATLIWLHIVDWPEIINFI